MTTVSIAGVVRSLVLLLGLTVLVLLFAGPTSLVAEDSRRSAIPQISSTVNETHSDIREVPHSPAIPTATGIVFRVTIEQVDATSNFDGSLDWDRADFFGRVRIDTLTQESPVISNDDSITPDWEFAHTVIMDDTIGDEVVTLTVGVWDADDFNNEQEADLTAASNRSIEVSVGVDECLRGDAGAITGNVTGACGNTLISEGAAPENTARIEFRVEAERPPSAPGLQLLCMHDPVWPMSGDTFEVEAVALDDDLSAMTVDRIDIFLQDRDAPANRCNIDDDCSASVAVTDEESIFYGCRARNGDETVWSGWRRVQIGSPPPDQRAVPVLYTGSSSSRVDIVLIPDIDSYSASTDADFLNHVKHVIRNTYYGGFYETHGVSDAGAAYGERLFLMNQDRMNFWIAQDMGDIDGTWESCAGINEPGNWGSDYTFADTGAILHTDMFRDCAKPGSRIFGSEWFVRGTIVHETLHVPFGLADEYCCDSHYFEPAPFPNIYASQAACEADIVGLAEQDVIIGDPPRTAADCTQMDNGWWKSEGTDPVFENDIMADHGDFNGADVRRVQYLFDRCASAACRLLSGPTSPVEPLGSPADPVPEFEWNTTSKFLHIHTLFESRTDLSDPIFSIGYGYPPMLDSGPPMLRLELFDLAGRQLGQHQVWHPLLRLGTIDSELQLSHGPAVWLTKSEANFIVPFSPHLSTIRLTDLELNQILETFSVRSTVLDFCAEHRNDPDCATLYEGSMVLFLPVAIHK